MRRFILILSIVMSPGAVTVGAQAPTVQREISVGCESCGGAAQFSSINAVAVAADGDIIVADRDAPMLRRFDANGKAVWSGGTKGRGPGEYQLIFHTAFLPDRGMAIVDMTTQRITALGPDHKVWGTTQLLGFPTTAGSDFAGTVLTAAEGPRGTLEFARWSAGTITRMKLSGTDALTARNSSVAISPSGVVAAFVDNEEYRIVRFDASGARLPDLTRSIERVRRTNEEEAVRRAQAGRGAAMVAAEARSSGRSGASSTPAFPEGERSLKPHAKIDGLRYDPAGRLWVHTMRGDGTNTVFDVFNANGTFAGHVTLPVVTGVFALGGDYLATAAENKDGVPHVIRWRVR